MKNEGGSSDGYYNTWHSLSGLAPAPLLMNVHGNNREGDNWRPLDNSVNAVSFGFVATAILISMFLIMAIFEKFLRPNSSLASNGNTHNSDVEAQMGFNAKLVHSSPKMTVYANGVSVMMPGDNIPSFIGRPAPVQCPPTRISLDHQVSLSNSNTISSSTQQNT